MKKLFSILLTLAVTAMLLVGCGTTVTSDKPENTSNINLANADKFQETEVTVDKGKAVSVKLGNDYSTNNDVEFTLFKIVTSDKLQAASGKGPYTKADNGYNFIDIVFDLTNSGTKDFSVSDNITGSFEGSDGVQYSDLRIVVEDQDNSIYGSDFIKPLATSRVHIGYIVPSSVATGNAYLGFMDNLYVINYDVNIDISTKIAILMNQEVTVDDIASFELLGTNYTEDVLPTDTAHCYSHYPVGDPTNNIYFVVYCNITNYSSSAKIADDMISMKVIFDGKYEYTAKMDVEKRNGTSFDSSITNVSPLETRKGVFMFDVPKKVQNMDYDLLIYSYGNEYSYNGHVES